MSQEKPTFRDIPPIQRARKIRDLARATWLRPRDVEEIYGIEGTMLSNLCRAKDPAKRLPSVSLSGKGGNHRGIRLVRRSDIDAYLERLKGPGLSTTTTADDLAALARLDVAIDAIADRVCAKIRAALARPIKLPASC
jgi:hypothetical protein